MTPEGKRRFAALTVALSAYASGCGSATPVTEAAARPYRDLPEIPRPRIDRPEDYAIPPRAPSRRPSRSRPPRPPEVRGAGACTLDDIKRMESGGNYAAVSPTGKYRGAYQFDRQTWASVDGTGDPAAASPEEQDARAAELMRRRGTQPWSVCR